MAEDSTAPLVCPHCAAVLELTELTARVSDAHERLGSLLQILAGRQLPGGVLVARSEPHSEQQAVAFATLVNDHDPESGPMVDALREAGYEIIELPESIYGAMSPSELL